MAVYEGFGALEKRAWSDDSLASGYVDLFASASDQAIPDLIAGLDRGSKVLDLCCGQGNVAEALLAAGHPVVGADFSPAMLTLARRRIPDCELVEADAQDLPFDDASFDAVVSNFGIVHVPDQPRALKQARRVLRPGGRFAMTSWAGPDVSPAFRLFYGNVREHGDPSVGLPDGPDFHQYADEATAHRILSDAGLRLDEHRQVECFWLLDAPEDFLRIFHEGAPRGSHLLRQQPEERYAAIEAAVTEAVRDGFGDNGKWRVPVTAALCRATAV